MTAAADILAQIDRDRWMRPLIKQEFGRPIAYQRPSTLCKVLDDGTNLARWAERMVAVGLSMRTPLAARVTQLVDQYDEPVKDAKDELNKITKKAKTAAGDAVRRDLGTELHGLMEDHDLGRLGEVPEDLRADLDAYVWGTTDVEMLETELFVVCDGAQAAGTLDRLVRYRGRVMVGDIKGLALTTKLPTPTGWTTMGTVQVGDQVFGPDGDPCTVTAKSGTKRIGTFIVRFDDGSSVVCDTEHIWWTAAGPRMGEPTAKSVQEVIRTLRASNGQAHHRVPVAGALALPPADLPIDPYVLGCWLGDGAVRGGSITKQADLFDVLAADGVTLGVEQVDSRTGAITRTVIGLTRALRDVGLLHNKHIPTSYLRASIEQRRQLLAGLMDTDGTWNTARNRACFTTTDKALALAVEELLLTLGQRPHLAAVDRTGYGVTVTAYDVEFRPVDLMPFRLPRKMAKAAAGTGRDGNSRRRVIVAIDPGPDVETACIAVDSPTRVYLAGEHFIPTHNTGQWDAQYPLGVEQQVAIYARGQRYDPVTGDRRPLHPDIDLSTGVLIHSPVGKRRTTLYPLDLTRGWAHVQLARQVQAARKTNKPLSPEWTI